MALLVRNPTANVGDTRDMGSIPGLGKSPGGGYSNPLQYSCPENSVNRGDLLGYRPQGLKESDRTEQLKLSH